MNETKKRNGGGGRKKIEIKRIEKEGSRQVCFSKRRQGLFKKANELATLCGAEVAILVFSLAGKPYSFGHPSVDHVFRRFLNDVPCSSDSFPVTSEPLNKNLIYLCDSLEEETKRRGALEEALKSSWPGSKPFWWDRDLSSMGIGELEAYGNALLEHQAMFAQAAAQQCCFYQAPQEAMQQIDGSPAMPEVGEADYFLWLQHQDFALPGYDFNIEEA